MIKRSLLVILTGLLLAACTARVKTRVEVFHDYLENNLAGQTITILPVEDGVDIDDLEFKHYRSVLENGLRTKNITPVAFTETPDLIGFLGYGITDGHTSTSVVSSPQWGQTGGSTTYHSGSVTGSTGMASYSGSSYTPPTYGITGYSSSTITTTSYGRYVTFHIFTRTSLEERHPQPIYQAHLISSGRCSSLPKVYNKMIDALIQVWPGEGGSSQLISIPSDDKC